MKRNILLSAVSAMLLGAALMPVSASDCTGFLPPNDLKIPVGSADDKGIVEAQFNEVMNIVEKIYKPQVAALGKVLELRRLWTDATVNASAQQSGNRYILNMYGGLARHETITMDGMALVACHELGHHLAGAPKVSSARSTMAMARSTPAQNPRGLASSTSIRVSPPLPPRSGWTGPPAGG